MEVGVMVKIEPVSLSELNRYGQEKDCCLGTMRYPSQITGVLFSTWEKLHGTSEAQKGQHYFTGQIKPG